MRFAKQTLRAMAQLLFLVNTRLTLGLTLRLTLVVFSGAHGHAYNSLRTRRYAFAPSPNRVHIHLRGANQEDSFMSAFSRLRILGRTLRSSLCLGISLSPMLTIADAPWAAAQNESLPGNQFAYVCDQGSGKILGYVVHSANGKL